MYLLELIEKDIITLKWSDTLEMAIQMMSDFNVEELPLIDEDGFFVALISLDFLEESLLYKKNSSFESLHLLHLKKAVFQDMHPYEVARYAIENKIKIIPILDHKELYIGVIYKEDLLDYFVDHSGIIQPGAIFSLKVPQNELILSNIIRICENNDVQVLHLQLRQMNFSTPTSDSIEVIIKTNKSDLRAVKAAFLRYDYEINYISGTVDDDEDMAKRYQLLMNYINM